ncbi:MAG TPA: hypothetical protein VM577_08235 [Anaerovoracaceae bacterium]|nr:hypothetical protein [Anaerovoracaceae bacterium]
MFIFPNKPIRIYDIPKLVATLPEDKWLVQPKWDGKRVHPFCDETGKVILFGRQGQTFKEVKPELAKMDLPRPWFGDGELLRDGRIFLWDYAVLGGKEVFKTPYQERLTRLQSIVMVGCQLVETLPTNQYQTILSRGKNNGLEGVVFKNKTATNLWGPFSTSEVSSQFKYRI